MGSKMQPGTPGERRAFSFRDLDCSHHNVPLGFFVVVGPKRKPTQAGRAILVAAALATPYVSAQISGSWLGGITSWSNVANWSSNPAYPGGGGTATFNAAFTGVATLDVPITLSGINFDGNYSNIISGGP